VKLPGNEKNWDADLLQKNLVDITTRWTEVKEVSVSASPTVKYKELVNLINTTQKTLPKVFISGG